MTGMSRLWAILIRSCKRWVFLGRSEWVSTTSITIASLSRMSSAMDWAYNDKFINCKVTISISRSNGPNPRSLRIAGPLEKYSCASKELEWWWFEKFWNCLAILLNIVCLWDSNFCTQSSSVSGQWCLILKTHWICPTMQGSAWCSMVLPDTGQVFPKWVALGTWMILVLCWWSTPMKP